MAELAEATPELVALHLAEAGEAGRAVGYWLKAGRRSAERSADREAVHQLRRGLDALATLPPSAERDRVELDFQLALGPRLVSTSSYANPDVAAAYERASALCESLQDAGRLIPVLWGLFAYYVGCGECRAALDLAERLRAAAEQGTDPVGRLLGHRTLGSAFMQLGRLREARSELEAAVALHDPRRDRALAARYITDPHASGLGYLALVLWMLGYADQARPRPWRRSGTPTSWDTRARPFTYGSTRAPTSPRCSATVTRSRPMRGQQSRWRASTSSGHGGDSAPSCRAGRSSVTVATRKGWPSRAKAWRTSDSLGVKWHGPRYLVLLAEIRARVGDLPEALRLVERARAQVQHTEEGLWEADVHRAEGELRRLSGASDPEVEACFAAALAVARQQAARSFELRAATSLARLWRDQGRRGEARDVLEPVYGWFTEGLDTPDLRDARELLDELR